MDYTDKAFGLLLIYLCYTNCQSVGSANPTLPVEGKTSNINHSIKAVSFLFQVLFYRFYGTISCFVLCDFLSVRSDLIALNTKSY